MKDAEGCLQRQGLSFFGGATQSVKKKVLPSPTLLSAQIPPLWAVDPRASAPAVDYLNLKEMADGYLRSWIYLAS